MARPISLLGTVVQIFGRRESDVVVLEQMFQLLYTFLEVKDITGTAWRQYFCYSQAGSEALVKMGYGGNLNNWVPAGWGGS